MRHNVVESMPFHTNRMANTITCGQLESGEFLEEALNRHLAFMRDILNTMQYWQDRTKELFTRIRLLGKLHAFLTLSAAEVHWDRLVETLEHLRVDPEGIARAVQDLNSLESV